MLYILSMATVSRTYKNFSIIRTVYLKWDLSLYIHYNTTESTMQGYGGWTDRPAVTSAVSLAEEPGWVPNSHMLTHMSVTPVLKDPCPLASVGTCTLVVHINSVRCTRARVCTHTHTHK